FFSRLRRGRSGSKAEARPRCASRAACGGSSSNRPGIREKRGASASQEGLYQAAQLLLGLLEIPVSADKAKTFGLKPGQSAVTFQHLAMKFRRFFFKTPLCFLSIFSVAFQRPGQPHVGTDFE